MTDLPNFEYPEKTEPISMVTLQGRCSPCGLDWSNHYDHLLSVTATQETAGTSGLQGQGGPSNERLLRRQLLRRHGEQPCCRAWSSPAGDLAMALADVLHCGSPSRWRAWANTSVSRDPCPGCDTALIDRQHRELEERFVVPKLFAFSAILDDEYLFGRAPDLEKNNNFGALGARY